MRITGFKALNGPPASYLTLMHRFPLRPLRSEQEYDQAAAISFELSEKAETIPLDPGENDYLDALDHFIRHWD